MGNKYIARLSELSIPLIAGVIAALCWANFAPVSYEHFLHIPLIGSMTFHFLINDIFMVFFFGLAGVEIMHSLLPGGHLNPLNKAITPLMATLGGILGPIAVFFIANLLIGSPLYNNGWAIPTATDIAISWLVARLIFGKTHPAISFLLLLAIADDAIGLLIIAVFYPNPASPIEPFWLLLVAAAMLLAHFMHRAKVTSYWPYLLLPGILAWLGMLEAHLHPALALVFIVPFLPHKCKCKLGTAPIECDCISTLIRFEKDFKLFVDFGLFFFGLANAGVEFTSLSALTVIVFLALLIGKTVGIFSLAKVAGVLGFSLPQGVTNKELFVLSMVAGIGLTVALFVSGIAYVDPVLQGAAKMGALSSAFISFIAIAIARLLKIKPLS